MAELHVRLVAMDHLLWEGQARMVVVVTPEGEMGIMPGHEPVLALLIDGPVRIKPLDENAAQIEAVVHGGFFSVARNQVSILGETAEMIHEIDVERAKRALERIYEDGIVDSMEKDAEIRARARLKAAMGSAQTGIPLR